MPAIDFDKETIGNILQGRKGLHVPINQRSYQWKKEHVEDLYKDLNGAITSNAEEYFLGTIIVVMRPKSKDIEVYDGQQRLATSMILIAAVRDYFFNSNDQQTARKITEESLYSVVRKTLQLQTHFGLSSDDNAFFIDRILRNPDEPQRKAAKADPKKDSHARILEAASAAKAYVADITSPLQPPERISLLHKWLDYLESGARVIWVEVEDQKTAYRIFETMNDRGLKLSAADLLKNYLYSLADPSTQQLTVVQKWQGMVAVLESLGDDGDIVDYIRYYWITGHGHTRSNELFDKIKNEVTNEPSAVSWSTTLELRAHDYAALYTSSHDAWGPYHPEVRARVETLRFLGVSQVRPLLLAAFGKFSQKEMAKLLTAAVNWSVRVLLTGVPSGTLEGHYSKNAKKVTDGEIKTVDGLAKELAVIIPDDGRFKAAVSTAIVANAQLARYYLRVLQMQADGAINNQYVPNAGEQVTLEHILPVNPGPAWINISTEDAKANFNRLGNQALLDANVNSQLGNVGYDVKKPALAASPFSLTKEAALHQGWGPLEITNRQERLADLAALAWPLK
jgi:uncharacterized protein DUF262/uncharacterized protein DUF1524